jgi:hypothetical protein
MLLVSYVNLFSSRSQKISSLISFPFLSFFFLAILSFELKAYALRYSTSPFLLMGVF